MPTSLSNAERRHIRVFEILKISAQPNTSIFRYSRCIPKMYQTIKSQHFSAVYCCNHQSHQKNQIFEAARLAATSLIVYVRVP